MGTLSTSTPEPSLVLHPAVRDPACQGDAGSILGQEDLTGHEDNSALEPTALLSNKRGPHNREAHEPQGRVAPLQAQLRKPARSSEDPAWPKIKEESIQKKKKHKTQHL